MDGVIDFIAAHAVLLLVIEAAGLFMAAALGKAAQQGEMATQHDGGSRGGRDGD
jgi:hypothetical protein